MTRIAGVDRCKAGWLAILEDFPSRTLTSAVLRDGHDVARLAGALELMTIDIPIGLPEAGSRACDVIARKMLGPVRGTSVFPAPVRAVLGSRDYAEACERSLAAQQKKLSKQAWEICSMVAEIDDLLMSRADLRNRITEVHPEVSFWAWNGDVPILEPKKTISGAMKRLALISAHFGADAFDRVRSMHKQREVGDNDILDAFAALWTAERIQRMEATIIPPEFSVDSRGNPMRMVY